MNPVHMFILVVALSVGGVAKALPTVGPAAISSGSTTTPAIVANVGQGVTGATSGVTLSVHAGIIPALGDIERCTGDLSGDGVVNSADLNTLLAAFGASASGDLDRDGDTDSADLNLLLAAFGDEC